MPSRGPAKAQIASIRALTSRSVSRCRSWTLAPRGGRCCSRSATSSARAPSGRRSHAQVLDTNCKCPAFSLRHRLRRALAEARTRGGWQPDLEVRLKADTTALARSIRSSTTSELLDLPPFSPEFLGSNISFFIYLRMLFAPAWCDVIARETCG